MVASFTKLSLLLVVVGICIINSEMASAQMPADPQAMMGMAGQIGSQFANAAKSIADAPADMWKAGTGAIANAPGKFGGQSKK